MVGLGATHRGVEGMFGNASRTHVRESTAGTRIGGSSKDEVRDHGAGGAEGTLSRRNLHQDALRWEKPGKQLRKVVAGGGAVPAVS